MHIDNLLSRLEKVKHTGTDQFVACCPAHQDKSPSLSIKALPDGRILIYCFAGCEPNQILGILGLCMEDLFPERLESSRPIKSKISPTSVLEIIYFEGLVIQNIARVMLIEKDIDELNYSRLHVAFERVNSAYNYYKD